MDANELLRLILNLIRKGSVIEVDHAAKKCRVESGGLNSAWLSWLNLRAGTTRTWNPPTIGEQVLLFAPGGETADAVVLCGIYSDDFDAPSTSANTHVTEYADGAVISYDHATHTLDATLPGGGTVNLTAPASVTVNTQIATVHANEATIDAPQTTCTGKLTVVGLITGQGGLAISGGGGGPSVTITGGIKATGTIAADGDVTAGDISLQNHPHNETGTKTGKALAS